MKELRKFIGEFSVFLLIIVAIATIVLTFNKVIDSGSACSNFSQNPHECSKNV